MTGAHRRGKTLNDVIVFWSVRQTTNFFPQNIKRFFENVQKVLLYTSNISALSKYDLQSLGSQLTHFWFHGNRVEAIESDLFEFTPNVEVIEFSNSQVKYVSGGAFSNLKRLRQLSFTDNPCHSNNATSRSEVIDLALAIESDCTHQQALKLEIKLNPTTLELLTTERELTEELKREITELKVGHEINKAEMDRMQVENANLKKEIENCSKIDSLMLKFEEFQSKIQQLQ